MTYDQPALFEVETPPVRMPTRKAEATAAAPKWTTYTPKRDVKCQFCMDVLLEAKGEGPASMPARWRRAQGGYDLVLCYGHARALRVEDGLEGGAE